MATAALAVLLFQSWRIDYDYSIDFQAYWLAGQRLAAGRAADLYAAGGGPGEGTPVSLAAREFKNLPLVAAPFALFSWLPYASAKRLMWCLNLAALLATAVVLGRWVLPTCWGSAARRTALALAAMAVMAPAHIALRHGQTTPAITLLLALSLAAGLRGRSAAAGLLLAPAALVKWPAWAPAAIDAARLRGRAVAAFAAAMAGAVLLSLLLFGPALHRQYLEAVGEHAGTVMTGHNNQSLAAVTTRLIAGGDPLDWTPRPMSADARAATAALALAVTIALFRGLWRSRRLAGPATAEPADRRRGPEFAAAVAASLLVLPVAWDHYMLLLAPGLAALAAGLARGAGGADRSRPAWPAWPAVVLIASYLALALPTPTLIIDHAATLGRAGGLLLSHYAAGVAGCLLVSLRLLQR